MNKVAFVLLMALTFFSCNEKVRNQHNGVLQEIRLKDIESNKIVENDVFNSIHFVRLETTDNCLIDQIEQISLYDDLFYVLDKKDNLFVFNEHGKFVRKIGMKGPGPEEYIGATMFYIHPTKKYISLFRGDIGVVRYDLNGNYLDRLNLDLKSNILTDQCSLIDERNVLIENSNSRRFSPYHYICLSENNMQEINRYFLMPSLAEENCAIGQYTMNNNVGKTFYAITLYNDTIYKWDEDHFIPEYILESGLKHPNHEEIKSHEPYQFIGDAEKILNKNGFSSGFQKLFSTDEYLCLEYGGLGYFDMILWEKKQNKGYLYRFLGSDNPLLHIYNNWVTTSNSALVRYMSVAFLFDTEKEIRATNHPEVPELYKNLKEEDNPVLVLYDYDKLLSRFK